MKIIYYLSIAIFIDNLSHSLFAHSYRSKSKTTYRNENQNFNWWPLKIYQNSQNNISLTIKPLSEEATSNLFSGEGKYLVSMRGWFFVSQPIIPLHIIIKNENSFPVMLSEKNIDLGRYWIGIKCRPVNIRNVLESLNNYWFWSSSLEEKQTYIHNSSGKLVGTATKYKVNNDPLLYCSFLDLDGLNVPSLFNLDSSILLNHYTFAQNSVMVEQGKTKELLLFAWGKQINSNFSITIAQNKFKVNLIGN